jgi:ABC-type transport system involved in cytochrome bd biosynthesis fused ATPase/permease subunit
MRSPAQLLLTLTRVWLPIGIAVGGVVAIVVGGGVDSGVSATGVGLLIVALIVWLLNVMFRLSVSSNRDREREEQARNYYSQHGRWPDD